MFCTTSETEGEVGAVKRVDPLVIHYWPFQCGSSVAVLCRLFFGIRASVTFHRTCVHIILVQSGLLSCH